MPIAIVLRQSGSTNIFRDAVVNVLSSGKVDEALLCSGFFQENFKNSAYQASLERKLGKACAKSAVVLTTVGIHNGTWKSSYQNFKNNMLNAGVNIHCFYKNGLSWHAKVFIASSGNRPVFGIVGSSNITRSAFSIGAKFNNECDVFLWSPRSTIGPIIEESLGPDSFPSVIRAPYSPRLNGNISLIERLSRLRAEVLEQDLADL